MQERDRYQETWGSGKWADPWKSSFQLFKSFCWLHVKLRERHVNDSYELPLEFSQRKIPTHKLTEGNSFGRPGSLWLRCEIVVGQILQEICLAKTFTLIVSQNRFTFFVQEFRIGMVEMHHGFSCYWSRPFVPCVFWYGLVESGTFTKITDVISNPDLPFVDWSVTCFM